MKRLINLVYIVLLLLSIEAKSQDRKDLEKQRTDIISQIERTQKNLESTAETKSKSLAEIDLLNSKITQRRKLLDNLQASLDLSKEETKSNQAQLINLEKDLDVTKDQYAQLLRYAYLKKKGTSKWTYILSADNLNKAFLRWRYTKQFESFCISKSQEILTVRENISEKNQAIQEEQKRQAAILESNKKQQSLFQAEKKKKDELLGKLNKDEKKLQQQLETQNREREALNGAIESFIIAELKTVEKEEKVVEKKAVTPVTKTFAKAKGNLKWPIRGGSTKSKFGVHAHPSIAGLKVNNNGIDISAKPGSDVFSVFSGKVIGVTKIPGYDYMVIIQHASYYTVYSKLYAVSVSKNEEVKEGQVIGNLDRAGSVLHFEVWKDKSKLDPAKWLSKK